MSTIEMRTIRVSNAVKDLTFLLEGAKGRELGAINSLLPLDERIYSLILIHISVNCTTVSVSRSNCLHVFFQRHHHSSTAAYPPFSDQHTSTGYNTPFFEYQGSVYMRYCTCFW